MLLLFTIFVVVLQNQNFSDI